MSATSGSVEADRIRVRRMSGDPNLSIEHPRKVALSGHMSAALMRRFGRRVGRHRP